MRKPKNKAQRVRMQRLTLQPEHCTMNSMGGGAYQRGMHVFQLIRQLLHRAVHITYVPSVTW